MYQYTKKSSGIGMRCIYHLRVDVLKALASHTRLQVLDLLSVSEMTVREMADTLEANQSTISCHLSTLRASGLVTTRKEGTSVYYAIADDTVNQMLELLDEMLKSRCISDSEILELQDTD